MGILQNQSYLFLQFRSGGAGLGGVLPFYVMGIYKLRPQVRQFSWRAFKTCCYSGIMAPNEADTSKGMASVSFKYLII